MSAAVIIPAIKKNVAFPDDLVKKLNGISLIQRAINIAIAVVRKEQVYIITDSEEIALISTRNNINHIHDGSLILNSSAYFTGLKPYLRELAIGHSDFVVISPYVPLISPEDISSAYEYYLENNADMLVPVTQTYERLYSPGKQNPDEILHDIKEHDLLCQSGAFAIFKSGFANDEKNNGVSTHTYSIRNPLYEIHDYEDWWICEKLLKRKRIVFRLIGNREVGMGHIYRCLSLAHEITDHEIRFVCDSYSKVAVIKLAGYDYWLGVFEPESIEKEILDLEPDMVINDIIDTTSEYIETLKSKNIKVVNFEDLGTGASKADLTINDLYDEPVTEGENILWGKEWFFLRDEFMDAAPHAVPEPVKRLLIAFGGTDPGNLTCKTLAAIADYCRKNSVAIDIVAGDGYLHINELEKLINKYNGQEITFTHATGVISHIMEKTEIAICSNGRTVYELAHMNIPAIVLSHHDREKTHRFASQENGFVPLGIYSESDTDKQLVEALEQLVNDSGFRRKLFNRLENFSFNHNKKKVTDRIMSLLNQ